MFVYHSVDPDMRVETIFRRERTAENGPIDFWSRRYRHICILVLEVEKNLMQSLSSFLLLFGDKKIAFKSPFELYFHSVIIEIFWFAKLQFKIEEKIHMMCLEVLEERFSCFPGRNWEGVCRKLLFLVKLYQWFCIWNIDQNLNMALLIVVVCAVLF